MTTKCAKLPVARVAALGIVLLSGILPALAQPAVKKKEYAFRGRVEQVDANAKRLTVASEPIEGWMGAMTMAFKVSNEEVLEHLKPGDQITAKVYEGDFTLYDVAQAPQAKDSQGYLKSSGRELSAISGQLLKQRSQHAFQLRSAL